MYTWLYSRVILTMPANKAHRLITNRKLNTADPTTVAIPISSWDKQITIRAPNKQYNIDHYVI